VVPAAAVLPPEWPQIISCAPCQQTTAELKSPAAPLKVNKTVAILPHPSVWTDPARYPNDPPTDLMRPLFASLALAFVLTASPAQAEKHTFVLANYADGYGIDRCLAAGTPCGSAAATAYCKSHAFSHAVSYRKVDVTGAIQARSDTCGSGICDQFVAIECSR